MGFISAWRTLYQDTKKWTWHHLVVFLITYFLYALYHACRKAFSNVKDLMGKSLSPHSDNATILFPYETWRQNHVFESARDANMFFGELDMLFLLAYAIGLFISGIVGDRVNLRYMLSAGILGSSAVTFSFGYLSVQFDIKNKMFFRVLFFLNGLFQSTGWPALIAVMGNWFSKSSRGLVFGIWSTNSNLGNMIGSFVVASVVDFGYEYGMLLNSILSLCGGIITLLCLIPHPSDINLPNAHHEEERIPNPGNTVKETVKLSRPNVAHDNSDIECSSNLNQFELGIQKGTPDNQSSPSIEMKPITFWEACMIPGVIGYAFSYACLKMVNYAFFFWLPTYLTQGLHWKESVSDRLSNFFDVGGIIGSVVSGVISDVLGYRSIVVSTMLFFSIGSVYMYDTLGSTYTANVILMVMCGCMLGGPASLICTAISSDLGRHEKIAGNKQALSTVSGIIDGTGSLGAAIGQYLVGVVSKYFGWVWVFNFLLIMISISFALILPILLKDYKVWKLTRSATQVDMMT